MKAPDLHLPSNLRFGLFFGLVFGLLAAYLFIEKSTLWAYVAGSLSFTFIITAIFKADLLFPLNRFWMRFGLFLGIIVTPIVLGFIFFGLLTPMAFLMRIVGRDELRVKPYNSKSYWIAREQSTYPESFTNQF